MGQRWIKMGQRFQIIISTPEYYVNQNNPNNKGREWFIYHSQWLYGSTAINFTAKLIWALQEKEKADDRTIIKAHNWERDLEDCLDYARLALFPYIIRLNSYSNCDLKSVCENNFLARHKNWLDILKKLDNNNGFLFIYITNANEVKYCFVNLSETENNVFIDKSISARDYISGYYSNEKLRELKSDSKSALEFLDEVEILELNLKEDIKKWVTPLKIEYFNGMLKKTNYVIKARTQKSALTKLKESLKSNFFF